MFYKVPFAFLICQLLVCKTGRIIFILSYWMFTFTLVDDQMEGPKTLPGR